MTILYKTQYDKEFQTIEMIYYWTTEYPYIRQQVYWPTKYNYRVVYFPEKHQIWIESDIDNKNRYKIIDIDKIIVEKN